MTTKPSSGSKASHRFSMLVSWSEDDQVYIVCVPELGHGAKTHGKTLHTAIEMATDLITTHVEAAEDTGKELPQPLYFDTRANYAPDVFAELPELRAEVREFERWNDQAAIETKPKLKTTKPTRISA